MNPTQVPAGDAMPSLWDLIVSGGPLMWPLGVCSVIALAYVVERFVRLRASAIGTDGFGARVVDATRASGPAAGLQLARSESTPLARILAAHFELAARPAPEREKRLEDVATGEVKRLAANLRPLMIVYIVAPLLGLLGTVWGLIEAFATVAVKQGLGRPELLAGGVYQALVTTAAGLSIAIPAVVAYYHFKGRLERFSRRVEELYVAIDPLLDGAEARHAHS
ncbi:MAG: MotA/TolQ/ExbB proton channel family protein [Planctomycetes bacterium]|nr:MotA/TolQ/ExbB proton channel family protein [Planctomycetota bacterium]